MDRTPATTDWPSTRNRIYQRFLGKVPRHKREPLDLVELIHQSFPHWSWLDIARWMDGSRIPMETVQGILLHWEQAFDELRPLAMPSELAPVVRVLASLGQDV